MAEVFLNGASARSGPPAAALRFGCFTLDIARQELRRGAELVPLRPKTFALLEAFARRPGRVLAKQELLEAIWPDTVVTEDSLTQCIHDLRTVLDAGGAELVRTVPRRGYRFDAEVVAADAPALAQQDVRVAEAPRPTWAARAARFGSRLPAPRRTGAMALAGAALVAAIYVLGSIAGAWRQYQPGFLAAASDTVEGQPSAPRLSLVVLPLDFETGSDGGPWFSDTLSADLTADLGKVSGLVVISRDTAFSFKGKQFDPRDVARHLNVRYVVRGTVRRLQNQVRLSLTLIDGETGRQRWSEQFEMDRANLQQSLEQATGVVSRALGVEMYRAEGQRAASLRREQVEADDLAMQGWAVWYRGLTRENTLGALRLFETAVARDPDSVRGWGGVALMNGTAVNSGWAANPAAADARQLEALRQLERIDRNDVMTYLARIAPYYKREDFSGLLQYAQELVAQFPNNPHSHNQAAMALMLLGRFDECVEPIRKAIRLGPRDTYLTYWRWALASCHFFAGRYPEAVAEARLSVQANAALAGPQLILAAALARNGQLEEARKVVSENRERPPFKSQTLRLVLRGEEPRLAEGRQRLLSTLHELGVP